MTYTQMLPVWHRPGERTIPSGRGLRDLNWIYHADFAQVHRSAVAQYREDGACVCQRESCGCHASLAPGMNILGVFGIY